MHIRGIGVDLVQISRFTAILSKHGVDSGYSRRFVRRVLHPKELPLFAALADELLDHSVRYIAGSWAAKEAVFKTLDSTEQARFQFKDWYRTSNTCKPGIERDPSSHDPSSHDPSSHDQFLLSISHDGGMLVATVLRQSP